MLVTRAESSAVTSRAPATAAATIPPRRRIGNANGLAPAVVEAAGPNSVSGELASPAGRARQLQARNVAGDHPAVEIDLTGRDLRPMSACC